MLKDQSEEISLSKPITPQKGIAGSSTAMHHSLCDDFSINYSRCVCVCVCVCWAMFCFGFISLHKLCTRISFFSVSRALFHRRCLFAYFFFSFLVLCNVAFTIARSFAIFSTLFVVRAHTHAFTSRIFMICMLSYMCMESLSRKNSHKIVRKKGARDARDCKKHIDKNYCKRKQTHAIKKFAAKICIANNKILLLKIAARATIMCLWVSWKRNRCAPHKFTSDGIARATNGRKDGKIINHSVRLNSQQAFLNWCCWN